MAEWDFFGMNEVLCLALVVFRGLLEFFTQSTARIMFFNALKGQNTCAREYTSPGQRPGLRSIL